MRKFLLYLLLLSAASAGMMSCSSHAEALANSISTFWNEDEYQSANTSKNIITRKLSLRDDVTEVTNLSSADIEYVIGQPSITVRGPENIVNNLTFNTNANGLMILYRGKNVNKGLRTPKVTITISARNITHFMMKGSGDLKGATMSGTLVRLQSMGSGDISFGKIQATGLEILTMGSGDIAIQSASCTSFSINTKGAGDISVNSVTSTTIQAVTMGSGDINIRNIKATNVDAISYGSGDLTLSGSATSVNTTSRGSGDVNTNGLKISR